MVRLSEFERHKRAVDLLQDLREAYNILDVFGALLKDRGDDELAVRMVRAANIVDDGCDFLNDFVKNFENSYDKEREITFIGTVKQDERQENSHDNQ